MLEMKRKNYKQIVLIMILIFSTFFLVSGCSKGTSRDLAPDGEKRINLVTSFYPIYVATINITKGIENITVTNMTKAQTGCLHDYQLTPWDLKLIESADAFLINGAGMESFAKAIASQNKEIKIIDSSQGITLLYDSFGVANPHVFVSVSNEIVQVNNIAKGLEAIDPKDAKLIKQNAEDYINKLEALKIKMHSGLKSIKNKEIITFHEAFPYFAEEFNLKIAAVIEREPGVTPAPKDLASTIDLIKKKGVLTIFIEPQYPMRTANVIARETGAKIFTLDPIVTGQANPDAMDQYILRMEENLKTLEEALI